MKNNEQFKTWTSTESTVQSLSRNLAEYWIVALLAIAVLTGAALYVIARPERPAPFTTSSTSTDFTPVPSTPKPSHTTEPVAETSEALIDEKPVAKKPATPVGIRDISDAAPANKPTTTTARKVARPTATIIFQPKFYAPKGESEEAGTGYFVKAPGGRIVGVIGIDYLEGEAVKHVEFLSVTDGKVVASFSKSFGPAGKGGITERGKIDLRGDYMLMPVEKGGPPTDAVLEYDTRALPAVGERVWFPNKTEHGQTWEEGKVTAATDGSILITLDKPFPADSHNGTPVLSQETGKVLGAFSRSRQTPAKLQVFLNPAANMLTLLRPKEPFQALLDATTKK